jgi:serine acetyltransferase/GT2 family glycosyltransferase
VGHEGAQPEQTAVAAVVIGRNEGQSLEVCLESLRGGVARTVYVDSGSTDDSVAIARGLDVEVVELDVSEPFSAARGRNAGFEHVMKAEHPPVWVQFVDGDCALAPEWIGNAVCALSDDPSLAAVCGGLRERTPAASAFHRYLDVEWRQPSGETASLGGIFMVRAEAFAAVHGFDTSVTAGEEPELCMRLRAAGWRLERLAGDMAIHDVGPVDLADWWRRELRTGRGMLDVATRFGGAHATPFAHAIRSARIWGAGWPAALGIALLLLGPGAAALVALALPAQMLRVADRKRRDGCDLETALTYGVLVTLGKLPQLIGQWRYRGAVGARAATAKVGEDPLADLRADLARYPSRPWLREQSVWPIAVYRLGRRVLLRPEGLARTLLLKLYWFAFRAVETLTGISLPLSAEIGPGLRIWHFGNVFVHDAARIGSGCTLRQGVTIGNRHEGGGAPRLGNDVDLGAYAQVLGEIAVGDGARIGAMSVVLQNIPAGATAAGSPARVVRRLGEQSS